MVFLIGYLMSLDIGLNVSKTDIGFQLYQRCGETRGRKNFVVPNWKDLANGLSGFIGKPLWLVKVLVG
jgi:hypothetical protein